MGIKIPLELVRSLKFYLLDTNKTVQLHGKCPHCTHTIEYYETHTSAYLHPDWNITIPELEEEGVMIGTCDSCSKQFKINIMNPDHSGLHSGYLKNDFYIHSKNENEKVEKYRSIPFIDDFIIKNTILTEQRTDYDFFNHPLYICDKCEQNIETLAFNTLKENWIKISEKYWNYINWSLANSRGASPKNIVIKFNFKCKCGQNHTANFLSKYHENNNFDVHSFSLINIFGSRALSEAVFGVYTKTTIMTWLYKLISRWNFLYDKIYIITPFIGHQFLSTDEKVQAWLEIINRLDPNKSLILVRNGQSKTFKNSFSKISEISYEEMERFSLGSELISEVKNKNNFHAKIYCAVSNDICEILNGSSNLVEGVSYEVINFDILTDYKKVFSKFLQPLGIENISEELESSHSKEYSLFFDEDNNFNFIELYKKDYINLGIHNIVPKQ
ncbi:hypothetical protein [Proteus mirabilis]|uniref:hypothetical protein n=1 Tax=Proteus mirabilis TaxID=584 RepID=UPI0034D58EBD